MKFDLPRKIVFMLLMVFIVSSCKNETKKETPIAIKTSTIAFGSCAQQGHGLPIFNLIAEKKPDLFIMLGDNIYGDTKNMDTLRYKYNQLATKPSYINL